MKRIVVSIIACLLISACLKGQADATPSGWTTYEFGGIKINIPYGTQLGRTQHFGQMNDDVISSDSVLLKMPENMYMLVSVLNRSEKYMLPMETERELSNKFKKDVSLSLINSIGTGASSVYYESETGTENMPAYVLAANKEMYNKEFTCVCYLFAKNNKVVNVLYFFENDNPNGGATDDMAARTGALMDVSIRSFSFE